MSELIAQPWPWYVAGPLIGLTVPFLLWAGGEFGVSANLRHICAAVLPTRNDFFRYDWKSKGLWNLTFALGIVLGADQWLSMIDRSSATRGTAITSCSPAMARQVSPIAASSSPSRVRLAVATVSSCAASSSAVVFASGWLKSGT